MNSSINGYIMMSTSLEIIGLSKLVCSFVVEDRIVKHFLYCFHLVVKILFRIFLIRDCGTWNLWNRDIIITCEIVLVFKVDIKVIEVDDRAERTAVTVDIIGQILLWPLTVSCLGCTTTCNAHVDNMKSIRERLC